MNSDGWRNDFFGYVSTTRCSAAVAHRFAFVAVGTSSAAAVASCGSDSIVNGTPARWRNSASVDGVSAHTPSTTASIAVKSAASAASSFQELLQYGHQVPRNGNSTVAAAVGMMSAIRTTLPS